MLMSRRRHHARAVLGESRSIVALEFALVAPVVLTIALGGLDGARALLIWVEIHNAANAIAQAAEKLSVTTNPSTGAVTSMLTADQMQQAMTTIYAEIPGLNQGNGTGLFPGYYAVALSAITYSPLCSSASGCGAQTASVLWTTYLTSGGPQLIRGWYRPCLQESQVAQFPASFYRVLVMASPVQAGGQSMTLAPQVVADVLYVFTPYFPFFYNSQYFFFATATMPAPLGGLTQTVGLNTSVSTGNVASCS